MEIYHFLKYNSDTIFNKLIEFRNNSITFCFDFEDSIQDILNPINTPSLKTKYRKLSETIIENNHKFISDFAIGIRINPNDSIEQRNDINCILNLSKHTKIKSILLPKTETREDIENLKKLLNEKQIKYFEIIPVIETVTGLKNLNEIIDKRISNVYKIAFGHCDLNLSCHNFPFVHQDNKEYWEWISQIVLIISTKKILFLNSPYQKLNDYSTFLVDNK
ncbi:MAG: hypothetical protein A2275_16675 [Bacteroidetes bacterium RIFOXYA12_FULL_35_11]|nr:MAG: hypothetical protein A2X01_12215 [Bacteroidetes bacterium GWF2_35_48]OFY74760.1 MAG: hypothetical protein A2275_16675 [Bacteroidetes bacterium RIFOXYA12_FULL_35_11]OFY95147.1 MAG: hypothetical protein A2491_21805 [Bacteroidetes bacterium RIFOXYC12_FULL_35_7]OFY95362.1 MAG: hypothetical protein A2309_10005 [Bacteroidetes bacterium RIFOXYB2_FULL_35_7]HBX49469.1 hypothetical protein [Bacteroidales bacterium]